MNRDPTTLQQLGLALLVLTLTAVPGIAGGSQAPQLPVSGERKFDFTRDIKPIFEASCFQCHGPEKPRSRFRLDNRDAALKGGDNGVDIIPGDSADSPLIRYVARLDPDIQMPPPGKGEPLTTNQIALLRTWIDQGAIWEPFVAPSYPSFMSGMIGFTTVNGDEKKYREHYWQQDGWNGGLESFELGEYIGPDGKFSLSGHLLRNDYRLRFERDQNELGFVHGGFEQYRKYYDDTGGYDPLLSPSITSLNRDLYLTIGRGWIDFGLTLPDWPRLVLGYEYQYRNGNEANLQWGNTNAAGRAINPASTQIGEYTHILKFDFDYEIAGTRIEDGFRGEFYHLDTQRTNAFFDFSSGIPTQDNASDGYKHIQGANFLRVERQVSDWCFGSLGYLFSKLDADASATVNTASTTGAPLFNWQSQEITLDRQSQVVNANALLGPWENLSLVSGVQVEWSHEEAFGDNLLNLAPIQTFSDLDTSRIEENVALRFNGIPYTGLFAEARLRQETINQSTEQLQDAVAFHDPQFALDTEFCNLLYDWRVGFNTSPWSWFSWSAHYRGTDEQSHYNNIRDELPIFGITPGIGYPGFIRARDLNSDEVETRLVLRPVVWLKAALSCKLLNTDYRTDTDPASFAPGLADISPGGELLAGRTRSQIYSANATLTPWQRLYFSGTFSYQRSTTETFANGNPSVVPYQGNIYSAIASATWVLSKSTDLLLTYSLSSADFAQDNFTDGLPLGIEYQQQALRVGVTRHLGRNILVKLQYGFAQYREPSSGGANNYNANTLLGMVTVRLP